MLKNSFGGAVLKQRIFFLVSSLNKLGKWCILAILKLAQVRLVASILNEAVGASFRIDAVSRACAGLRLSKET